MRYLVLLGLLFLVGCASVQPYVPASSTVEHKFETNYELNRQQVAFVGDPMIRVRDYYVHHRPSSIVRADRAFVLDTPFADISVAAGDQGNIIGVTSRETGSFRLLRLPHLNVLAFLLNDDGTFEGSAINGMRERMGWTYKTDPPDARMIPDTTERIDTAKGYVNFELVYGGTAGDTIQVLYREYTQDNLARPAFNQQLVYSKSQKLIRFKNLQIEVAAATNNQITFKVIGDGSTP